MRIQYIYSLSDPVSGAIRYVGKTINPKQRYEEHLRHARTQHRYCCNWIKSLTKQNLRPVMKILQLCDDDTWQQWESWWIETFLLAGYKLTNGTRGGDGVNSLSTEVIQQRTNTRAENNMQAARLTGKYIGVLSKPDGTWNAHAGKRRIGRYYTPEAAARVRDWYVYHTYGPTYPRNFPNEIPSIEKPTVDKVQLFQRVKKLH